MIAQRRRFMNKQVEKDIILSFSTTASGNFSYSAAIKLKQGINYNLSYTLDATGLVSSIIYLNGSKIVNSWSVHGGANFTATCEQSNIRYTCYQNSGKPVNVTITISIAK